MQSIDPSTNDPLQAALLSVLGAGPVTRRIAAHCIVREGYSLNALPANESLLEICDIVLTRHRLGQFQVLCLVDGETHPGRQFGLLPAAAVALAKNCRAFSRRSGFGDFVCVVEIVEVSRHPFDEHQKARLQNYRRPSLFSKDLVLASMVEADTGRIWNNSWRVAKSTAQRALNAAPVSDDQLDAWVSRPEPPPLPVAVPVVSYVLTGLLFLVFTVQKSLTGEGDGMPWLVSLGGVNQRLVLEGQLWRWFTAPFLHLGLVHLLLNAVALLWGGGILERLAGHSWFAAVFAVSTITGFATSALFGPSFGAVVGASGGILGVACAAILCAFVRSDGRYSSHAFALILFILLPTLLNALGATRRSIMHVDHAAHLGGAIGGAVVAALLLSHWPRLDQKPPGTFVAWSAILLFSLGLGIGILEVALTRERYAVVLVPRESIPRRKDIALDFLARQVERYPDDPRPHLARALQHVQSRKLAEAESELAKVLTLERTTRLLHEDSLWIAARVTLAEVELSLRKPDRAREAAGPICNRRGREPSLDELLARSPSLCR